MGEPSNGKTDDVAWNEAAVISRILAIRRCVHHLSSIVPSLLRWAKLFFS